MTTWERITYDLGGTRQIAVVADPRQIAGRLVGIEVGLDGRPIQAGAPAWILPEHAKVVCRTAMNREQFTPPPPSGLVIVSDEATASYLTDGALGDRLMRIAENPRWCSPAFRAALLREAAHRLTAGGTRR